jgi:WhiB family redox-sensing transcriptional regulator
MKTYITLARAIESAETIPPCQTTDFELWFAETSGVGGSKVAKKLCQACPVKVECLGYALDAREPHGIWGGMTVKDRLGIRRGSVGNRTRVPSPALRL